MGLIFPSQRVDDGRQRERTRHEFIFSPSAETMSRKQVASVIRRALLAARSHSSSSTAQKAAMTHGGILNNNSTVAKNDEREQQNVGRRGYASDAAVSTSGSNGNGSMVPVNSGAILNALKTPNSEPNYAQENHRVDKIGDPDKRAFTYFVLTGGRMIYASAIRLAVLKFLMSMSATADVLALASLEVDLSKIQPGTTTTVKWRGKPVFIRRRTADEIAKENAVDLGELRDKQADADRTQNPEWLVVVGVCTHLGCVPIANAGDYNGWFCPCHGSHYDASGRIRKGPAPENLEVPEYSFQDETTMIVG
jgi:ubiquinol-cytochrome c reductase iron-sulfur subunit